MRKRYATFSNMQGVSIAGRIDELTVAAVDRDKIEKIRSFKLGAGP